MGKPTGFLEFDRQTPAWDDPKQRIKHWREFHDHGEESVLQKQGARCKEIPFFFLDRTRGTSKLTLRIGLEALWIVWWLRIADLLGRL